MIICTLTPSHALLPAIIGQGIHFTSVIIFNNGSFIIRRHLVVDIPDEGYPHLGGIIAAENVADKVGFHLHVHLEGDRLLAMALFAQ
jgi:hypothetical protein